MMHNIHFSKVGGYILVKQGFLKQMVDKNKEIDCKTFFIITFDKLF